MSAEVTIAREAQAQGVVARITISNPAKLNVIGTAAMRALSAAFAEVSAEPALRAVVLQGAGEKAFIGGVDIAEMAGLTPETGRALIETLHAVCSAIRACPVPVIARMQGYTLGGGLEIAAACDLRLAAAGARFGMPETRIGIPSVIEAALLPQLIGWGRTRRLLFTGAIVGAETAEDWGLVEEVVPAAELDAAIGRVLADILACGPRAIRQQKALIQDWEELTPAGAIARGIDCFAESWRDPEPGRMMAAFLASKRKG
jgi:enoyl-CoA hydratase/carnithine racemase